MPCFFGFRVRDHKSSSISYEFICAETNLQFTFSYFFSHMLEFNKICKQKENYNLQKLRKKVMQKKQPRNNAIQTYCIFLLFEIETLKSKENSSIASANPVIQLPPTTIFLSKRSLFRNEKERRQRG